MSSARTKEGAGPKQSHSLRVHDDIWDAAVQRATSEGHTINSVIEEILEGYALRKINFPRITKDYTQCLPEMRELD